MWIDRLRVKIMKCTEFLTSYLHKCHDSFPGGFESCLDMKTKTNLMKDGEYQVKLNRNDSQTIQHYLKSHFNL